MKKILSTIWEHTFGVPKAEASTLIYGPDSFTVGSNINLPTYNSLWTDFAYGTVLQVQASTDDVREPTADNYDQVYYNGVINADQRITATLLVVWIGSGAPDLSVRNATDGSTGYNARWGSEPGNTIILSRNGIDVDSFGASGGGTQTFTGAFIKAVTLNASTVRVTYGDDTNGIRTFDDTDASRPLSGQPAIGIYNFFALTGSIDLVSIYDESPVSTPITHQFLFLKNVVSFLKGFTLLQ